MSESHHMLKDIGSETTKALPPVGVIVADAASGWTMNHTVMALTIIYLVLQIGWLLWRWRRQAKGQKVAER